MVPKKDFVPEDAKTKTCQASVDDHLEQISPDSTLAYFVKGKLLKGFVIGCTESKTMNNNRLLFMMSHALLQLNLA